MATNQAVLAAFEIADDSMQATIGHFLYCEALHRTSIADKVKTALPADRIPITHGWDRFYSAESLLLTMTDCFELYSARVGLLAVVASFEAALGAFIATLEAGGHVIGKLGGYKHRIEWAFETVSHSTFPDAEMRARIPDNCADVEHARRIRNVFMHRNGAIDDRYLEERSRLEWIQHRTNSQWLNDKWIILHPPDFLEFVKSHIELLHILHDSIQTEYYGQTEPYDYRRAQKALEWHRILVGV